MTPEEQKTLAAIEAAKAAGQDPFGDDEPLGQEDDAPADTAGDQPDAGETPADGAQEDVAATDATPPNPGEQDDKVAPSAEQDTEQPMQYQAEVPADYQTKRAELVKAKADVMRKLLNGEVDADEFAAEDARISGELEELSAARIRAETLQEANVQNQQAYQKREIQKLIRAAKTEVDYTKDVAAIKQFDQALAIISADPDNAGADYAELIGNAHKMVMALRGLKPPAAPATQRQPRGPGGEAPVTLRSLPAASTPNVSGGVAEQLSRLSGPAYEAAFSKLSPAQRAQMLDEQGE